MKLRAKKLFGLTIFWPCVWFFTGFIDHYDALRAAGREYRFHSKDAWTREGYAKGHRYIRNYKPPA